MRQKEDPRLLTGVLREATCPACGYHVAVPFFDGGRQPLATIAWPGSAEEAQSMPRLPLDFVRCVECGHVFNAAFDYSKIPYSGKPNMMFNKGAIWAGFIRTLQERIMEQLPSNPVVVEIGHGDGSFLGTLGKGRTEGRFVGFDPHGAAHGHGRVELRAELFEPARHLSELAPDLVITRHVLEHLVNPLGFLQRIAVAARCLGIEPRAYFEVPCIDRAIETGRTVDFYYEHSSQFTTESFTRMLKCCGARIDEIGHGYDGEVIYGFLRLGGRQGQAGHAAEARSFYSGAEAAYQTICAQLSEYSKAGKRIAVWGGTGKSAAFMQRYAMDAERFPIVVDSDAAKVDTFVPGTGQCIRFRDWLLDHPVDVIIIPPQWRAADIVSEMEQVGIRAEEVLIEHQGRLIDFLIDDHPYSAPV